MSFLANRAARPPGKAKKGPMLPGKGKERAQVARKGKKKTPLPPRVPEVLPCSMAQFSCKCLMISLCFGLFQGLLFRGRSVAWLKVLPTKPGTVWCGGLAPSWHDCWLAPEVRETRAAQAVCSVASKRTAAGVQDAPADTWADGADPWSVGRAGAALPARLRPHHTWRSRHWRRHQPPCVAGPTLPCRLGCLAQKRSPLWRRCVGNTAGPGVAGRGEARSAGAGSAARPPTAARGQFVTKNKMAQAWAARRSPLI